MTGYPPPQLRHWTEPAYRLQLQPQPPNMCLSILYSTLFVKGVVTWRGLYEKGLGPAAETDSDDVGDDVMSARPATTAMSADIFSLSTPHPSPRVFPHSPSSASSVCVHISWPLVRIEAYSTGRIERWSTFDLLVWSLLHRRRMEGETSRRALRQ